MGVFLRDCPHCPAGSSTFTIHNTFTCGNSWRAFASCGACGDTIVAVIPSVSGKRLSDVGGDIGRVGFAVSEAWPDREAADAPAYTPTAVASRYRDGEFNFAAGRWNAAVGLYRATLDLATKALEAKGETFFKRLKWLADQHKEDAEPLRHFTEMFLRYVFEMPGRVAEFRGGDKA